MTNSSNNGATLEDCHSNFFALTDLCGIKWKKLVSDGTQGGHQFGPLDDPVLLSYARCLASDILCVWRRSPTKTCQQNGFNQSNDPFQLASHNYLQPHAHPTASQQILMPSHTNLLGNTNLTLPQIPPVNLGHMGPNHGNHGMRPMQWGQQGGFHSSSPTLSGSKELWIFWYGEEPNLAGLVNPQLLKSEADQGSWENGLTYECRTLLFKALHNLIERCLLARDFVRIGKWFIQPCDSNQRIAVRSFPMQLSFKFAFFVHGESTVCMSVDVRQHPAIRRIAKHHLVACQAPNQFMPVILAPHGLSGTLTGVGYRINEPATHKILEEWKHFYPIDASLKSSGADISSGISNSLHSMSQPPHGVPPVLEVIVGGVRLRYPSCYVLCTDLDDSLRSEPTSCSTPTSAKSTQGSPVDSEFASCATGPQPGKPQGSLTVTQEVDVPESLLSERVWQESVHACGNKSTGEFGTTASESHSTSNNSPTECVGNWEFSDPTKKSACMCFKCKSASSALKSQGTGHVSGVTSTKGGTKSKKSSTFHKRIKTQTGHGCWGDVWDASDDQVQQGSNSVKGSENNNSQNRLSTPGTPGVGPPSYKPGAIPANALDGHIASPASVAPSPLPTPRSQPASVPQLDVPMPTLSPQPITEKPPAATPDCTPISIPSVNQVFSPVVTGLVGAKAMEEEAEAFSSTQSELANFSGVPNRIIGMNNVGFAETNSLKRPMLPNKEYEALLGDEAINQLSDLMYDYSIDDHGAKRLKLEDGLSKTTAFCWGWGMKSILELPTVESEDKCKQNTKVTKPSKRFGGDPYDFPEEQQRIAHEETRENSKKREFIKEEEKHPYNEPTGSAKVVVGSLFTIEGLQPSLRDLDQLFDNSDTSSDETFQAPTPPGSNKPSGSMDEIITNGPKSKSGLGILRPEELSKMFPTPPSHEPNPIASPCGLQPETPSMEPVSENSTCSRRPQDSYPGLGSPPDEPIEDWTYVYKAVPVCKMLGSSKYAPLPSPPSQLLPSSGPPPTSSAYTPTWQFVPQQQVPPPQPSSTVTTPIHTVSHPPHPVMGPSNLHLRPGLSPISPVPNSLRGPQFDIGSPASNSMYLKGHLSATHTTHAPHAGHGQNHHLYGRSNIEAHALVVNLSISDSLINMFRDHNFDSCTMCVCNAGVKVVGNIRGSEVGIYLPDTTTDEDPVRCNCGFSASANRRLAHRAGLFYEDELDITTSEYASQAMHPDEWYEKKKPSFLQLDPKYRILPNAPEKETSLVVDTVPPSLLEMLREQCLLIFGTSIASRFSGDLLQHRINERQLNALEYLDGNRAALTALEHGRTIMLEASGRSGYPRLPEDLLPLKVSGVYMHKWPYLWAKGPQSSQDIMQVMRALLPLLQDAVHAKAWDAQYTVSGPLTWRQFHRLAGRGTDDRCEPQPIPSILVGSEKDWVALSPLSIKFWEKLLLEPYSYPRDVAYIVVAPDNDLVLQRVRVFFRELSSMYEICQLGKHCSISKVLRDGILRVGKTAASKLATEPVDEWFTMLPDIPISATLRLYAQVCRHYLAPQLAQISLDQSLLDPSNNQSVHVTKPQPERPTPSPKMPPPNSDSATSQGPSTPKSEPVEQEQQTFSTPAQENQEDDERDPPAIVIYLVEPFGFASDSKDLHRMANLGLMRCFTSMLSLLPENVRNNVTLQIISLEDLMLIGNSSLDKRFRNDQTRALALTVYSQCRRLLLYQNNVKSLTGFGPAAASEMFLKVKEEKRKNGFRLYTPPYVLAPTKEKITEGVEWLGGIQGHTVGGMVSCGSISNVAPSISPNMSSVLYVAYCISEDQRWLLASVTDDKGELLETTTISLYVPNRSKRRKASSRKHGLMKLMDFIVGIMTTGTQPWRLVVGRLGRIGHGELESWSTLLSRKSLLRASNQLKDVCRQCSLQYPFEAPCVLSACLVSLEPDSCLRLMPDQFTPDERFGVGTSASSTLSTPHDVSCTHILVFPTSATTQSSQTAFQEQHINGPDLGDEDLLFINVNEDMSDGIDGMQDLQLGDIFSWADTGPGAPSPVGSPRRDSTSQPGSPGGVGASGRQSPFQSGGQGRTGGRDGSDELGTILQQPLALGYLVSTAPFGHLPPWFWSSCPQRAFENGEGVFLKSALHLHSHSVLHNMDDLLQQQSNAKQHPLDSQFTTDVLRFVLEGYNALSWLCLDPTTHDRRSCLPVHIQKLLHLYYSISSLV